MKVLTDHPLSEKFITAARKSLMHTNESKAEETIPEEEKHTRFFGFED